MGVILLCLCAAGYMIWQVMDIYPEGYTAEQLGIVVQHVFGDAQVQRAMKTAMGRMTIMTLWPEHALMWKAARSIRAYIMREAIRMMNMASAPMSSGMPLRMQGIR